MDYDTNVNDDDYYDLVMKPMSLSRCCQINATASIVSAALIVYRLSVIGSVVSSVTSVQRRRLGSNVIIVIGIIVILPFVAITLNALFCKSYYFVKLSVYCINNNNIIWFHFYSNNTNKPKLVSYNAMHNKKLKHEINQNIKNE